jgi:hypothetical protein
MPRRVIDHDTDYQRSTDWLRCYTVVPLRNVRLKSFKLSTLHPLDLYTLTPPGRVRGTWHECSGRLDLPSGYCVPVQIADTLECFRRSTLHRHGKRSLYVLGVTLADQEQWRLWKGVELTAVALEVFIFGISLLLVWSLRMRFRLKAMVVFAFSVRLL